jgi:hypothetical protein
MTAPRLRPSDEQLDELIAATAYSYEAGEYPRGLSRWAARFTDGDGGLMNALEEWRAERHRLMVVLDGLDEICAALGIGTTPETSGTAQPVRGTLSAAVTAALCEAYGLETMFAEADEQPQVRQYAYRWEQDGHTHHQQVFDHSQAIALALAMREYQREHAIAVNALALHRTVSYGPWTRMSFTEGDPS